MMEWSTYSAISTRLLRIGKTSIAEYREHPRFESLISLILFADSPAGTNLRKDDTSMKAQG